MGVSDDRPQREAAQVEPGAFAGDGAGEYRGHPDNWAKQGAAAAPNGGDPEGPAHAPVDKDAPYDMPSIPRAGATDADFAAGTTVERVVGHDEWRALVPEMVAVCFEAAKRLLKPWEQILEPPLSADYVAERIVLAPSPPEGYVARERGERRRMQGFVLICDFCTFSKSLRWTSTHPAALAGTFDVLPHERVARRRAAWPRNASAAEVADGAAGCHRSSMEARTLRKVDDSGAVARTRMSSFKFATRWARALLRAHALPAAASSAARRESISRLVVSSATKSSMVGSPSGAGSCSVGSTTNAVAFVSFINLVANVPSGSAALGGAVSSTALLLRTKSSGGVRATALQRHGIRNSISTGVVQKLLGACVNARIPRWAACADRMRAAVLSELAAVRH